MSRDVPSPGPRIPEPFMLSRVPEGCEPWRYVRIERSKMGKPTLVGEETSREVCFLRTCWLPEWIVHTPLGLLLFQNRHISFSKLGITLSAVQHAPWTPVSSAHSVQVTSCRISLPRSFPFASALRTTALQRKCPEGEGGACSCFASRKGRIRMDVRAIFA